MALEFGFTPLEEVLLFDYTKEAESLNAFLQKYPLSSIEELRKQPKTIQREFEKLLDIPTWRGMESLVLQKIQGKSSQDKAPLFEKIRQGEVWRLFSSLTTPKQKDYQFQDGASASL